MKRPIILLFPIVTELLLYASGVPIQQNRGNSLASSDTFPIDSSLAQPSDLDHVSNVLHPRASVRDLLNPEPQTSPDAPTSSASHGSGGSANTLLSIHSIISPQDVPHPDIIPGQVLSRYGAQSGPAPLALPPQFVTNSHQQHVPNSNLPSPQLGTYVPMNPSHSTGGPLFRTPLLPHHAGIPYQGSNQPGPAWEALQPTPPASVPVDPRFHTQPQLPHNKGVQYQGSHRPFHGTEINPKPGTDFDPNAPQYRAHRPLLSKPPQSSAALASVGATHERNQPFSSAPDDPDRLPKEIPASFSSLRAHQVAAKLKLEIGGKMLTPKEAREELVNGMLIIKTLFQRALEENQPPTSNALLTTWGRQIDELPHGIVPESELQFVTWWNVVIHRQMRAIAKLYDGRVRQVEWDRNWIDNLSTTQLKKDRKSTRFLDYLRIMGDNLPTYGPINYLRELESIPHTYEDLLTIAEELGKSHNDDDINNVLVLRRKAIQIWMLKGMSTEEFVEQKRILRRIVADRDERDLNKIRAEMVIISLQRFIEAQKIELTGA